MINRRSTTVAILSLLAVATIRLWAQTGDGENIILGRPTSDSIVVHALADEGTEVFVEYGESPDRLSESTDITESSVDGTAAVTIEELDPDTQ